MVQRVVIDGVTLGDAVARVFADGSAASMRTDGILVYEVVTIAAPNIAGSPAMPDGVIGSPYSYTPVNSGGAASSWSASGLPAGLSINAATGEISGTPTTAAGYSITITATNVSGSSNFSDSITIAAALPPPNISGSPSFPAANVGLPFSWAPASSGGGATSYTVQSGSLPSGLSLNPITGAITGTPTAAQSQSITIRAINSSGVSDFSGTIIVTKPVATVQLSVSSPIDLTHASAPSNTTATEITFNPNGGFTTIANVSGNPSGTYLFPALVGDGANYEIIATQSFNSGTAIGSPGTYLLNSNRRFGVRAAPDTVQGRTMQFTIREVANHANSVTFTVNFTSEKA